MYRRNKKNNSPLKKYLPDGDVFTMEDYCSILLMIRRLDAVDGDIAAINLNDVPLISRTGLEEMPDDVAEEFDKIINSVNSVIERAVQNPETFQESLIMGDLDFVGEYVNRDQVTQAIGNVLLRKIRLSEGLYGEEAFAEAKSRLSAAKDDFMKFVTGTMGQALEAITHSAVKAGISPEDAANAVSSRVEVITKEGLGVNTSIDRSAINSDARSGSNIDPSYL